VQQAMAPGIGTWGSWRNNNIRWGSDRGGMGYSQHWKPNLWHSAECLEVPIRQFEEVMPLDTMMASEARVRELVARRRGYPASERAHGLTFW